MFEIVALVTQIGTSEPLEVRLNHPFESVKQCEEYKDGNEFAELTKELESRISQVLIHTKLGHLSLSTSVNKRYKRMWLRGRVGR